MKFNYSFTIYLLIYAIINDGCSSQEKKKSRVEPSGNYISEVWVSDNGDGTYKNPVIFADYSDPDVCRVGDDFYLTASSFNCVPGLPVLHSRDLVNWKIIGYALDKLAPAEFFDKPQHGNGVFAPSIRYHKGEFFIYFGDPDFGIFMLKTRNPAGEWESPVLVKEGKGLIDPCPLWDDDGRAYLVHAFAASRAGIKSIIVVNEMTPEGTSIINNEVLVFDGHAEHPVIEGPKFYKRNGYYYIFAPGGGVKTGWQTVLRSRNIYGPYEDKIVMHQGKTNINGPHQGAWVELKSGESWFLHFQDQEAYGRVVHLQPMMWKDDWPVIGLDTDGSGCGEPVLTHKKPDVGKTFPISNPAESDEFNTNTLGLQWQWHGNPKHFWAFPAGPMGFLRMNCIPLPEEYKNMWCLPNLLLQKFPAPAFTVTTRFTFQTFTEAGASDKTGLIIMGTDYAYLSVEKENNSLLVSQVFCYDARNGGTEVTNERHKVDTNVLYFRVSVVNDALCTFSYSIDGEQYTLIGKPFTAAPGRWIGAKVGLFAIRRESTRDNGFADFDWFRVSE